MDMDMGGQVAQVTRSIRPTVVGSLPWSVGMSKNRRERVGDRGLPFQVKGRRIQACMS